MELDKTPSPWCAMALSFANTINSDINKKKKPTKKKEEAKVQPLINTWQHDTIDQYATSTCNVRPAVMA